MCFLVATAAGGVICVAAQDVDGFFDIVVAAVGAFGLDLDKICSVGHVVAFVGAVPAVGDVFKLKELGAVAVEDIAFEFYDALVVVFHAKGVVGAVAVWREGVWHVEHRRAGAHGEVGLHLVGDGVAVVYKTDGERDTVLAGLAKLIVEVCVVAHEVGCVGLAVFIYMPFVEWGIVAHVLYVGLEKCLDWR